MKERISGNRLILELELLEALVDAQASVLWSIFDKVSCSTGMMGLRVGRELISVLLGYVSESQKEDFAETDDLFSRGCVSQKHFGKLFKARDLVVKNDIGGLRAYEIESVEEVDQDKINL